MTDTNVPDVPPEDAVDFAYWLLKRAKPGKSMWEDPDWDYTKKGGEFKAAHPAHLNNVPFVHKDEIASRSRAQNAAGTPPQASISTSSPPVTELAPATMSTSCSFSPRVDEPKPATDNKQKAEEYVPPHLRGWGAYAHLKCDPPKVTQLDGVATVPKAIQQTDISAPLKSTQPQDVTPVSNPEVISKQPIVTPSAIKDKQEDYIPPHLRGWSSNELIVTPSAIKNKQAEYISPYPRRWSSNEESNKVITTQNKAEGKGDLQDSGLAVKDNGWEFVGTAEKDEAFRMPELAKKDLSHSSLRSAITLGDQLSNVGIEEYAYVPSHPRENIRAKQGEDPRKEFLDYDGVSWVPPPLDWEHERGEFDLSFMPAYCKEWAAQLPGGQSLNIENERFISGFPVCNYKLMDEIEHGECIPDVAQCENNTKRLVQCSANSSSRQRNRMRKQQQTAIDLRRIALERVREIESQPPEPHPHAPAVELYIRPALQKDISGIISVYNKYIEDRSIIQGDQELLSEDDMFSKLKVLREMKFPVIVAIKGDPPKTVFTGQKEEYAIPPQEQVIGFAWVEPRAYGTQISTKLTGRSRANGLVNLYVHTDFVRKGVGRCLMDRIMQISSPSYVARDGYEWINPRNDSTCILGSRGAKELFGLIIEYPVRAKEDYTWFKDYVWKWFFTEEGHLKNAGRSSKQCSRTENLDIIIFQLFVAIDENPFEF